MDLVINFNQKSSLPIGQSSVNSYITLDSETQYDFSVEIGMHADVKITQHFFLRGQVALQFSGLGKYGSYEIVDIANGNTLYSGGYAIPSFTVSLFNATAGVGYRF